MSDEKKEFTPQEAAIAVLKKAQELYKNSELYKSNSAHEVDPGEEPNNEDAECPESLADQGTKFEAKHEQKKKKVEGDSSDPAHEQGMGEEEEKAHDAAENEADEQDSDNIEADEEQNEKKKIINAAAEDKKEKKEAVEKALFNDKAVKVESVAKPEYSSKKDVADDIKWELKRLKEIKELKWTVEDEAPEAKKAMESLYASCKKKIKEMCKKYSSLKKSVEEEIETIEKSEKPHEEKPELHNDKEKYHEEAQKSEEDVAKFCKYCGSEKQMDKCGEVAPAEKNITQGYGGDMMKKKPSKLKGFLNNKNAKVEKMIGMKPVMKEKQ